MFDIPVLSALANEGNIFDPAGNMNMVISIVQAVTTVIINQQFRKVATWTANFENHKTQYAYDYSVFIKRFIFEFTDFQLYLFYIGIYQMHMGLLRTNLISLFCVDEFRRILCESILPYFMVNKDEIQHKLVKRLSLNKQSVHETADTSQDLSKLKQAIIEEELKELELGEIELFDDYLEMIMTYGYITLFASAFPFGSTITCAFIFIEIRSDIFKFEKTSRRPISTKTNDIGTWQFALNALTYGSIFTNLILCCFASDQIDTILPFLKNYRDFSKTSILTAFSIEHVIVAIVIIFKWLYDTDPYWLTTYQRRKTYKNLKKASIEH